MAHSIELDSRTEWVKKETHTQKFYPVDGLVDDNNYLTPESIFYLTSAKQKRYNLPPLIFWKGFSCTQGHYL